VPEQVEALVQRIEREQGRLDILVNDIWGAEHITEWNVPVWQHSLEKGLRILDLGVRTHLITNHFALPLLIRQPGGLVVEVTDGTEEYNREEYRLNVFYDLAKTSLNRVAWALAQELKPHGCAAVSLTPGWMRSEIMLELFGISEDNWREGGKQDPHFLISETPRYTGRAIAALASDPEVRRWNGRSLSSGELAEVYGFTDIDGSRPNFDELYREVIGAARGTGSDNGHQRVLHGEQAPWTARGDGQLSPFFHAIGGAHQSETDSGTVTLIALGSSVFS
jgi:Dehydrogenases with different specificities (related to short-chain alcohol dehydrogenases)